MQSHSSVNQVPSHQSFHDNIWVLIFQSRIEVHILFDDLKYTVSDLIFKTNNVILFIVHGHYRLIELTDFQSK